MEIPHNISKKEGFAIMLWLYTAKYTINIIYFYTSAIYFWSCFENKEKNQAYPIYFKGANYFTW